MAQPLVLCKTLLVSAVSFRRNFLVPLSLCFLLSSASPFPGQWHPIRDRARGEQPCDRTGSRTLDDPCVAKGQAHFPALLALTVGRRYRVLWPAPHLLVQ